MPGIWNTLTNLGLSSPYAITGSVILNSLACAFNGLKEARLANFASGLYLSGLTLFSKGSLIPSITAEITKNTLGCFVKIPAPGK